MEIGVIARAQTDRIEGWIDEANRVITVSDCLLIDERQVAGPHRRRKTGSAILVRSAGSLVSTDVKGEIRVCRNIRAVAIALGA
jgi:hypothetical protein